MRGRRPSRTRPSSAGSSPAHEGGRLGLIALEKRIAFDAALVDTAAQVTEHPVALQPTPEPVQDASPAPADTTSDAVLADLAVPSADSRPSGGSIIFIDSHVDDIPSLLRGLNNPGAEIILLDSMRDGVEQIASTLDGRSGLSAIHIISHGDAGRLQLGNAELTQTTMTGRYGSEMAVIRNALGADADILLYGCDVAAGDTGAAFIRGLAALTGADIAASEDITGSVDFGGDWDLEASVGEIDRTALYGTYSFRDWHGTLTLAVTTGTTAAQTVNAFTLGSGSGITTSAQTLNNTAAAWYGTFTTTGSNLGLAEGAVLSTGLAANLPGNPATAPNASSPTTGISAGSERDIGTLSFNFQVATGVTKISAVYVMGSEEYPEYTGQGFSDNVTITLNGGAYTNTNIALVPGTSTGVDIDTINATNSSQYYRGATTGAPTNYALTDIVLDGFTTVLSNVRAVAAATTYTVTIKVADFTDNQYDSAVFINYFGSSLRLDLDGNNSTAANAGYAATYTENGAAIAVLDTDAFLTNYDSTTDPVSATIRLTNAQTGDVLSVGSLPAGITSSIDTSVAGVITVQLSGSSSEANYLTALNAIRFSNSSENPSTLNRNITFSLSDGATVSNTATTTLTVVSVNDAPVNTLPASYTTSEDTALQLTGLAIADADHGGGLMLVTLGVDSGSLSATSGGGVTIAGSGTASLTLSGTLASINSYLAGGTAPTFSPAANASGAVTLTMTTGDNGNTGTGGILTDVDTRTITVNAVNDAPVNTLPASFATTEEISLSLAGLAITDIDAGSSAVTVTLSVTAGTLAATTGGSVTVAGSGTGSLSLSGTVANINAYLAAVGTRPVFVPAANGTGTVTLTMVTNDGGNTGSGGALTDTDVATITIAAVNDAPVNTLPASFSTNEDTSLSLAGLAITDIDAGSASVTVTLSVTAGTLTATTGGSVTVAGSGSASLSLSGTVANINAYLAAVGTRPVYVPVANTSGSVTLTMVTNDGGNTGSGGALTDTDVATITVTAINDAPVNTLPASFSTTEDTSLSLAGLAITDIDAGSSAVTVTLSVTAGTLTATTGGSVTVAGSGTGSLSLSGTVANINAYLAAVGTRPVFVPAANGTGTVTLTMVTDDGGNTGSGGALTDTDVATITIAAVNDAPVNTLPANFSTNEDTSLSLAGLSISDDAGASAVTVTLSVTAGTLTATTGGSVTVAGSGSGSLSLSGTVANINAYLAAVGTRPVYVPVANTSGSVTLTMVTNDGGNTGSGGALTDTDVATITIAAVNDAPVNTLPASFSTSEDTPFQLTGLAIADVDGGNAASVVQALGAVANYDLESGGASTIGGAPALTIGSGAAVTAGQGQGGTSGLVISGIADSATHPVSIGASAMSAIATNGEFSFAGWARFDALNGAQGWERIFDFGGGALNNNILLGRESTTNNIILQLYAGGTIQTSLVVPDFLAGQLGNWHHYAVTFDNARGLKLYVDGQLTAQATAGTAPTLSTWTSNYLGSSNWSVDRRFQGALDDISLHSRDLTAAEVSSLFTAGNSPLTVTLSVGTGSLSATSSGGVTVSGSGTSALTLSGTLAGLNAYLAGSSSPTYTPVANANGPVTLTMVTNDGGNSGSGGALTDTDVATITIAAVNDAPVNTLPASYATNEDTSLQLTGLSVSDDATSGTMTVTLGVTAGTLTATTGGGVTIAGSGTASLTLSGTLASINSYLAGASAPTYVPVANASGAITLTMTTSDNGNTGTGGTLTDVDTRTITVTAVNDAPVNTLPASFSTSEDTSLSLAGLAITDIDAGSASVTVTLSVTAGTLTATTGGSVTVAGSGSASLSLSGTLANINAYLAAVGTRPVYVPVANTSGSVTLTMVTNDGGNTGSGGALTDTDVAAITLTAINDAPVNTLPASFATSEDTPLQLTGLAVTDVDAGSAPLTLTLAVTQGTLSATPGGGVTIAGSGTGSLTLSGTQASLNSFLAGGSAPLFTPLANANGPVTLTMVTNDGGNTGSGGALTDTDVATITVTPVNDAPVDGDENPVIAEDGSLTGALLANAGDGDGDTLTLTGFSWNGTAYPPGPPVTLTGIGTLTIASDGTYSFVPAANYHGSVPAITYSISDGQGGQDTSTLAIAVTPVNDAPLAADDSATVDEDGSLTGSLIANDSDGDGDTLTITGFSWNGTAYPPGPPVTLTGIGTLTIASDGTYSFVPAAQYDGPVPAASYTLSDGTASTTATLAITLTAINDAPVNTLPASFATSEDTPLQLTGLAVTDVDAGSAPLTLTLAVTQGTLSATPGGGVTIAGSGTGSLTLSGTQASLNSFLAGGSAPLFTPLANANGPVTLTMVTNDGGNTGSGGALTDTDVATITVTPVNDAPVDGDENPVIAEDGSLTGALLANAGDGDGDTLTLTGFSWNGTAYPPGPPVTLTGIGTLTIASDGTYSFVPAANYHGSVPAITYSISDGQGGQDTSTLAIAVTPVNDAPLAADDSATVDEDGSLTGSLIANDSDGDGDTLTITGFSWNGTAYPPGPPVTLTGIGTLTIASDGTYSFVPAAQYDGPVPAASYTLSDGTASTTATLAITLTAINDAPVNTLPASFATSEDTPLQLTGLAVTDVDAGSAPLTLTLAVTQGTLSATPGGGVTIAGSGTGSLTLSGTQASLNSFLAGGSAPLFTPLANANGPVTLTMVTNDGGNTGSGGALTDTDVATITVTPVNDAPVDGDENPVIAEDGSLTGALLANAGDGDGDTLTLTGFSWNGTAYPPGPPVTLTGIGTLTIASDGTYSFVPAANYHGSVPAITYSISDGQGGQDTSTLAIAVTPVNDAPLAADDSATVDEDGSLTGSLIANDSDGDGDTLTITGFSWNGTAYPPGPPVTLTGIGTLTIASDGTYSFVPAAQYDGPVPAASYTLSDGTASTTATLAITLTAINDAPVNTLPASFATSEDTPLQLTGLAVTDVDAGSAPLTLTLAVTQGTLSATPGGGVTIAGSGTGSLTLSGTQASLNSFLAGGSAPLFTPLANANGPVTLTMVTNDGGNTGSGGALTDTDVATITVTPVNDAPVDGDENPVIAEDGSLTGALLANAGDGDGDTLTLTGFSWNGTAYPPGPPVTLTGIGTLTIASDGTYSFVPAANYHGSVPAITYSISDGQGGQDTSTLAIAVTPVNDAPLAADDSATVDEDGSLTGSLIANDSDGDGDTLTITGFSWNGTAYPPGPPVTLTGIGTLTIASDGTYSFVPAAQYDGTGPGRQLYPLRRNSQHNRNARHHPHRHQ